MSTLSIGFEILKATRASPFLPNTNHAEAEIAQRPESPYHSYFATNLNHTTFHADDSWIKNDIQIKTVVNIGLKSHLVSVFPSKRDKTAALAVQRGSKPEPSC